MRRLISFLIIVILLVGFAVPVLAAGNAELDAAVNDAAAYILRTVRRPVVDSVGGEWAVIGLARSGYDVPDSYYENYYRTVERYVIDCDGVLHDRRYTDYSRVILGLTAAGYDPRDVAGYDLTEPLEDFDKTIWQGINGPIFALIALDSMDYPNSLRDNYIAEILRRQLDDGGWNLTAGASGVPDSSESAHPDITGMALQALAKYQDDREIKIAIDRALECLSGLQNAQGGYSSLGSDNNESAVQVLVALCELGISVDDARFVKNGNTLVDYILSFRNTDGSFRHTSGGGGNSQMSSEQALYGLVAAQRALEGRNSLYRMDDAVRRGEFATLPGEPGLPGRHTDVTVMPIINHGRTFPDIENHPNRIAIEELAARGIINGKSETEFDPDATMTRAEFAAIVTRGLGLIHNSQFIVHNYFEDVAANDWFNEYVCAAAFYEIVYGVSETAFNPNGTITRQEAAVMVGRAASLCGMETERSESEILNTLAPFGDYRTVASWARSSMAFCYDTGILDDSEFDIGPSGAILRYEIAEMLYRMLTKAELL